MKSMAVLVVTFGLLLAMAAPSMAHGWGPAYHHYHGYLRPYYYGGYRPVVVAPPPVYGYPAYPPVVAPAAPVVTPVVPSPYYYYGAPGITFGYRGPRVGIGVGF